MIRMKCVVRNSHQREVLDAVNITRKCATWKDEAPLWNPSSKL